MTTDDILSMAQEAGFHAETVFMTGHEPLYFVEPITANSFAALEHFFRLAYAAGAVAEREECAKVCYEADKSTHPSDLGDAIRARGTK